MAHFLRSAFLMSLLATLMLGSAQADGIVAKIVNSPLNSAGMVKDGYTALNVYLQKPDAEGIDFFDPSVPGFGIPPGGHIEVEMREGFTRNPDIQMDAAAIHMVAGAPQQGLSSKNLGYQSAEGKNPNTFIITAQSAEGLPPEVLLPRAAIQKLDPVPNSGLKVFHIGLRTIAFSNTGETGVIAVRIVDGHGNIVASGEAEVEFWDTPRPQIHPNNFLNEGRNHNWQSVFPGETVGRSLGTLPLTFMLFEKPDGSREDIRNARDGILGAGILSSAQLAILEFDLPEELARYDSGLIVRDTNDDGLIDPHVDQIIGGVSTEAPNGDTNFEVRSVALLGRPVLSQPTAEFSERAGARIGGAIMQVQFRTGKTLGKYRPTFALLKDPTDLNSGDGSSYTYTILAR